MIRLKGGAALFSFVAIVVLAAAGLFLFASCGGKGAQGSSAGQIGGAWGIALLARCLLERAGGNSGSLDEFLNKKVFA